MPNRRVLFVDDDLNVLSGLRRMLRPLRDEWDVTFLNSGRDALAYLEANEVDVIVSDMRMPELDGNRLFEIVRQRHPNVVRIMLSGFGDETMILQAGRVAHQFLAKPCDSAILKTAVARACALRELLADSNMQSMVSGMESVPTLPNLYHAIMDLLAAPESSIRDVGNLIAQDVGMTAKLLQLVNSAYFGLRHQVTDPAQAASLAGLDTIKALVLNVGVFSCFNEFDGLATTLDALDHHSTAVGLLARRLAVHLGVPQTTVDDAPTAGMLHDVGAVILAANYPEEFREAMELSTQESVPLHEAEMRIFGASHAEIGAYLLGLWGLPDSLVEAVAYHHRPSACAHTSCSLLTVTHLANALVHEQAGDLPPDQEIGLDVAYLEQAAPGYELAELRALALDVTHAVLME